MEHRHPKCFQNSRHTSWNARKQPNHCPCRASSLYHTHRLGQNPWQPLDLWGLSQMCTSFQQIMAPPTPPCFLPMRHPKHINITALAGDFHECSMVSPSWEAGGERWRAAIAMEVPLQSLQAVSVCGLPSPLPPEMKSRLTVEAADASSLCRCHDTLGGPVWHGPSWQWMGETGGGGREKKGMKVQEESMKGWKQGGEGRWVYF